MARSECYHRAVSRALDAVLLDLGGTLDGRSGWRERFHRHFTACRLADVYPFESRVRAFDHAEERSHAAGDMTGVGLRDLLRMHIAWQFESLGGARPDTESAIVDRFVADTEQACAISRDVLAALARRGYRLGVVSNGCGNVAALCAEYGFTPFLSVVVDSHVLGCAKPDPAIMRHALARLEADPARTAFVGDSIDRDIEPAKALGLRTVWVSDGRTSASPAIDVAIDSIAELPGSL